MTPGERLGEVLQLMNDEHLRRWSVVREAYPNASEDEVYLRFGASQFDRALMINAFGWDTDLPEEAQQPYSLRSAIAEQRWRSR
jgi:hypothetical protein